MVLINVCMYNFCTHIYGNTYFLLVQQGIIPNIIFPLFLFIINYLMSKYLNRKEICYILIYNAVNIPVRECIFCGTNFT